MQAEAVNKPFGPPRWDQLAVPLTIAVLALVLWTQPQWHDSLDWSRSDLADGQWWRLVTGHLLHSNTTHLLMNLGGLALIFALHQPHYRIRIMAPLCLLMVLMISLGLLAVPDIARYVGLSALLHGLFTWGACRDAELGWRSGYLLLLGVLAKVGWEQYSGGSADVAQLIDARIAVESHLLGVVSALVLYGFYRLKRRYQRSA